MKVTLSQIKSWFKKGMYPTESQFANAFESFWHKDDTLPLSAIQNLAQVLNDKASVQLLKTKADADHKHTLEDITDIDDFKIEVDAKLSETSENPVQNKVVKEALDAKQPVGNYAEENHNHDEAYSPLEHEHSQYLTEHQDISDKQDKTDNSLLSNAKTIVGAFNELWGKVSQLWDKVEQLWERMGDSIKGITHITYAELKALRDSDGLSVGTWYRITDYETTVYNNANARAAGHPFDILVLATDVNQLSEDAKAVRSARDTEGYFAHANLAAWKLKYSLDNDSAKFAWASDGGEKWTVTLPELGAMDLTPVSNNDSTYEGFPYKFTSNVQGMAVEIYFAHLELQEGEEFIPNIIYIAAMGQAMTNQFPVMEIVHEEQTPGKGVIWELEDEYNNLCCYDFKNVQFKRSLIIATKENPSEEECAFYGKYVGQALEELPALPEGYAIDPNASKFLYTFSVIGADGNVEDNSLGVDLTSAGMGIIHLCGLNQIKANVNQSSFAVDLNNTVFVSTCNSIEDMMNLVQIGNSFGTLCMGNTFVNGAMENIFGNYCAYNTFGNGCDNNSFGNGCQYNDILDNVRYVTAFEGVMYVSVGSTSGTVQYAQILNGTRGSDSSNKLQINFATGKNYTQCAGKNSSGELKIWVPADMVPAA